MTIEEIEAIIRLVDAKITRLASEDTWEYEKSQAAQAEREAEAALREMAEPATQATSSFAAKPMSTSEVLSAVTGVPWMPLPHSSTKP